jgi:DNA-binding XRE family transcriptional regulator
MTTPIEFDTRYKVNQQVVDEMRKLRNSGLSYNKIAKKFGISNHTVYYWTNEEYRKHKQLKNSKRKYIPGTKEDKNRIKIATFNRKILLDLNIEPTRMRINIDSASAEKRCKRYTIYGIEKDKYKEIYNEKYKKGGTKIK